MRRVVEKEPEGCRDTKLEMITMMSMIMITKMKTTIKMITVDDDDDDPSDEDGHLDVVTKSCKKRFSTHWSNLQSTSVKFCWEHFIAFDNMYFI